MTDYTPTTDYVRTMYGQGLRNRDVEAQFDRWLAAHDRAVAEKAWERGVDDAIRFTGEELRGLTPDIRNPYRKEATGE